MLGAAEFNSSVFEPIGQVSQITARHIEIKRWRITDAIDDHCYLSKTCSSTPANSEHELMKVETTGLRQHIASRGTADRQHR
jgi:hypothetical protein